MPINIVNYIDANEGVGGKDLGQICVGEWDLIKQFTELHLWAIRNSNLPNGEYLLEVLFNPANNVSGAMLSSEAMKVFGEIGATLLLTEQNSSSTGET